MSSNLTSAVSISIPSDKSPCAVPPNEALPISSSEDNGAAVSREITFVDAVWELGELADRHYYAGHVPDFGEPSLTKSEYVDNEWHLRNKDRKLIAIVGRDAEGHVRVW